MRREQAHELLAHGSGGAKDAYVDPSSLSIHVFHSTFSAAKKKPAGLSVRAGGFLCF
jgi:hypothetical protein